MCQLGAVTGGQETPGARHFVPQNLMLDLLLPKRSSWRLGHRASAPARSPMRHLPAAPTDTLVGVYARRGMHVHF